MESIVIEVGGRTCCEGVHVPSPTPHTTEPGDDPVASFAGEAVEFALMGLRERFRPDVIVDQLHQGLLMAFDGPAIAISEGETQERPVFEVWRVRLDFLGVDRNDPSQCERIIGAALAAARRTLGLPAA